MKTADELRAEAAHLRKLRLLVLDPAALGAINQLIEELEWRAAAIDTSGIGSNKSLGPPSSLDLDLGEVVGRQDGGADRGCGLWHGLDGCRRSGIVAPGQDQRRSQDGGEVAGAA